MGNPENRRIVDFQAACVDPPECVSWLNLRRPQVTRLRIDSPGENAAVSRLFTGRDLEHGEVALLREYHAGFCRALDIIEGWGLPCQNSPADIRVMFDKWACHQRFVRAGVPRPQAFLAPPDLAFEGSGRLFLKPLHGSSGSGVGALRWTPDRVELVTPLRVLGSRLFNSLQVQRYREWTDVRRILTPLLAQGMIAEQWVPKLTLKDGCVDLRILVIAGEARHRVVRQSRHPLTNLHLGNQRGAEDLLDAPTWQAACRVAEQAARCFPDSLVAGVDVLLDTLGRPYVGEINAFGDLLPRLTHRGETAYEAIARAV